MDNEKYIIKGFNAGYLLREHNPELAKKLYNGFQDKEHPYAQGFRSGVMEYTKEQMLEQEKGKDQARDNTMDLDRDR